MSDVSKNHKMKFEEWHEKFCGSKITCFGIYKVSLPFDCTRSCSLLFSYFKKENVKTMNARAKIEGVDEFSDV